MQVTPTFAGIDTHKDTLAVAIINTACRLVAGRDVTNTEHGFDQLVDLLDTHQVHGNGSAEAAGAFDADPAHSHQHPLTDLYGVGPLVAARFIAEVVDVRRYPDRNAFAAANGTAPLPASSGRTVRHRFNPGGNRQFNWALYTMALTQIRSDTEGLGYFERKRAAGKTNREALRCLKRRLSDIVFTTMRHDATGAAAQPDRPPQLFWPVPAGVGAVDANEARLTA